MARYSVVEFNDKSAAVICNSWFVGEEEEYCLWPNEQSTKVGRLAKAEQQPCIEWKKYKIRVLGKAGTIHALFCTHRLWYIAFNLNFLKAIIKIQ